MLGAHSSPLAGPSGSTVQNTQHALHASLLCGTDCGSVGCLHQSLPPSVGLEQSSMRAQRHHLVSDTKTALFIGDSEGSGDSEQIHSEICHQLHNRGGL